MPDALAPDLFGDVPSMHVSAPSPLDRRPTNSDSGGVDDDASVYQIFIV